MNKHKNKYYQNINWFKERSNNNISKLRALKQKLLILKEENVGYLN